MKKNIRDKRKKVLAISNNINKCKRKPKLGVAPDAHINLIDELFIFMIIEISMIVGYILTPLVVPVMIMQYSKHTQILKIRKWC